MAQRSGAGPTRVRAALTGLLASVCVAAPAGAAGPSAGGAGAELQVTVRAASGAAVADVAILVEPTAPVAAARHSERAAARMDQRQRRFVPEVLVVETGTLVEFPNSDSISHQVYSFSPPRRFRLPLYKGRAHPPIAFDTPGLVVLGCNIHDDMVGYIVVTDSPYHAETDANGQARVTGLPPGVYRLRIWGPRIADDPSALERRVEVGPAQLAGATFRLTKPLLAQPTPRPGRSEWDAY